MALILIVDDQIDSCRPMMLLMKHIGYEALCLTSGEQALAYLRTARPDLMILDVMMPGMDGMEVLRHIRADPQMGSLAVVMFSAISDPIFQAHAREKGANDYWVKASLGIDDLKSRVAALLATDLGGHGQHAN